MLRSQVGRDKSAGQMDISSKVKNSRWVSNLGVGVLCDVDGRNDNLVLLEEVADWEAEARVADTLILPWAVSVPWTGREGESVAGCIAFGDLVLIRSTAFDENDTARFVDLYRVPREDDVTLMGVFESVVSSHRISTNLFFLILSLPLSSHLVPSPLSLPPQPSRWPFTPISPHDTGSPPGQNGAQPKS